MVRVAVIARSEHAEGEIAEVMKAARGVVQQALAGVSDLLLAGRSIGPARSLGGNDCRKPLLFDFYGLGVDASFEAFGCIAGAVELRLLVVREVAVVGNTELMEGFSLGQKLISLGFQFGNGHFVGSLAGANKKRGPPATIGFVASNPHQFKRMMCTALPPRVRTGGYSLESFNTPTLEQSQGKYYEIL